MKYQHNYSNDKKYFTLEFWDETSWYDTHPTTRWVGGHDYTERLYKCRIPCRIQDNEDLIEEFIFRHSEDEGFWI